MKALGGTVTEREGSRVRIQLGAEQSSVPVVSTN
jgi:hypothetical protein